MKEFKYVITDAEGIHARPATMLVKKAAGFKSDINIEAEGKKESAVLNAVSETHANWFYLYFNMPR